MTKLAPTLPRPKAEEQPLGERHFATAHALSFEPKQTHVGILIHSDTVSLTNFLCSF